MSFGRPASIIATLPAKKNLMYYRMDGHVVGVLNDRDLTSVVSSPGRLGNERTGTIPFVPIELLRPDGQAGEVEHIYRHDMESLIWVFVWLCFQYKGGKSNHGPLDVWAKGDASLCVTKKLAFLHSDMGEPSHLNYAHQFRLTRFYDFLDSTFRPRRSRRISNDGLWIVQVQEDIKRLEAELVEEPDDDMFKKFVAAIT
ncbi:hypothetical protein PAXINDRAFT_12338 [Paxillus involutus ATCC 200175]|uniref:Fungal-type protein kinase domain-containing protein n=1 Tax=Paxillus involutus ATCC 200175 TaxID=664439 RepID=A0A0C9U6K7_PAXIN|nr:hypothetical protein PAXINDRAFT_12338 [Paxillus involutus ATCC 200175]